MQPPSYFGYGIIIIIRKPPNRSDRNLHFLPLFAPVDTFRIGRIYSFREGGKGEREGEARSALSPILRFRVVVRVNERFDAKIVN